MTELDVGQDLSERSTYVMKVAEFDAAQDLPEDASGRLLSESRRRAFQLFHHRSVDEFEDEVEMFSVMKHFDETYQILVSEQLG